jgi:hypothetical protein
MTLKLAALDFRPFRPDAEHPLAVAIDARERRLGIASSASWVALNHGQDVSGR